jgi:RNA polymerase sigma-70 factor (ECF subfamily)
MSCEKTLIERIQTGKDEKAFEELMELHRERTLGSIKSQCRFSPVDPNEVWNIALVKVWNSIGAFRGDSKFSTWLYHIVRNVIYNEWAKLNRISRNEVHLENIDTQTSEFSTSETPLSTISKEEFQAELGNRICGLKMELGEKHRKVFELVFEQGKSYSEVAQLLDCPRGTVMSRVFAVRRKLQAALEKYEHITAN